MVLSTRNILFHPHPQICKLLFFLILAVLGLCCGGQVSLVVARDLVVLGHVGS